MARGIYRLTRGLDFQAFGLDNLMKFLRPAVVCFTILGCILPARSRPVPVADYTAPINVVCVGDSITAGYNAPPGGSFASQLSRLLGNKWNFHILGIGGTTMLKKSDNPYWNRPEYQQALSLQPDVVIIELGTNDTKPNNWNADAFATDYQSMITAFQALPRKPHIYLCLPPPVFPPGGYNIPTTGPGEVIPVIQKLAGQDHCDLIDFNTALQTHSEWLPDHVHPNADGGFAMAKIAYAALTGTDYTGTPVPLLVAAPAAH
jgi:acyl-CoA thioesterase-1